MTTVRTNGLVPEALSSDAPAFYREYWHAGEAVDQASEDKRERLFAMLFDALPLGQTVLEIGVGGEGGMIRRLQSANEVHGLDVSESAIACCRRWGLDVAPFNADADRIPFPNDAFDVVFALEVCEHLANPQFAIEEIRRVLKPGGRFIVSTPNPLIHHWPRYFYASLIEPAAFREFLDVNQLAVVRDLSIDVNLYSHLLPPPHNTWSLVWDCRCIKQDAVALLDTALAFWRRTSEEGIRLRPIEAADLARAALTADPTNIDACGLLAAAAAYRVIYGEERECKVAIERLMTCCSTPDSGDITGARFWLVALTAELRRFGHNLLPDEELATFVEAVRAVAPARAAILDRDRAVAARLAAR